MFQMSNQLFTQCWPAIAARIEHDRILRAAPDGTAPPPATSTSAEAGYVLGVAMGYALSARVPAGTTTMASKRGPSQAGSGTRHLQYPFKSFKSP